jgi:hypothetical protein
MTQKANPSINRPAEAYKTAGAIAYGGHGDSGFIVEGASPTDISTQDAGINETNLEAFRLNNQYSATSFDVTIDPGEAFVFGSWIAIDTQTTVTLASDTTGQTVYAGWNKSGPDDVIIGLDSAFSSAGGDTDEKIPLFTFDTDTSGVTNVTDDRQIGRKNTATDTETENLTLAGNQLDSDGDGVFDNADVNALTSLSQGDSFSGYPLSPSTDLSNDSVTITSGDGISGGGSVSLGGSTTVSINASDFVGAGLSTDGSNNIDLTNDSVTITSGTDLTGGGTVSLGGSVTIDHANTSSQGNITTGGSTVIDDITLDGNGHVSGLNTENRSLSDWNVPSDFNINNADKLGLPQRSTDPAAAAGDIWYRTDLD